MEDNLTLIELNGGKSLGIVLHRTLYKIAFMGSGSSGGQLPKELTGSWTTPHAALKVAEDYAAIKNAEKPKVSKKAK